MDYNLLFRWFVGLSMDEPVWDATVFCKNRDRLLEGDIAAEFMAAVLTLPEVKHLLSSDHFSVDGTLIQAWASMKSFRRRTEPINRQARDATPSVTSIRTNVRMRHTPPPPTQTLGWRRRQPARKPSWLTPDIC